MKIFASALVGASLLASAPLAAVAQTEPVIIEAESATNISSAYATGTLDGASYVTIINDQIAAPTGNSAGALTYTVTFPAPGNYDLYARFRVGPGGGSDDSFFVGNGFGDKVATGEWSL